MPFDSSTRVEVVHLDDEADDGAEEGNASREEIVEDRALGKRPMEEVPRMMPPPPTRASSGKQPSRAAPGEPRLLELPGGSNYMNCDMRDVTHLFPLLGTEETEFFRGKDSPDLIGAMASSSIKVFFLL